MSDSPSASPGSLCRKGAPALIVLLRLLAAGVAQAQTQPSPGGAPTPPGVPEPGLILWGTAVNQTNPALAVAITSAAWTVSDGSHTATFSASSRPAVRIVSAGGQSFYVLQVPFDTRQLGTLTLADPASSGTDSFELKSASPPTYTLIPIINGAPASIRAIDGAPTSGNAVPISGFSAASRGRVVRVDLAVVPAANNFEAWATSFFGNATLPEASRTADPDLDGMNNEGEFAAGTNPKDPNSSFRILTLTLEPDQARAVIAWKTVPARLYSVEASSNPEGPWTTTTSPSMASGESRQSEVPLVPADPRRYFRIRIAP